MVSGSISLLYFPLAFHGGRQGSGPDSPEVWGDFPYVRLSVCSLLDHPAMPEAQPAMPEA